MNHRSQISQNNDQRGSYYQQYVARHLSKITGDPAFVKDTHGIDLVCGDFKVEVKGTKSFYYGKKRYNKVKQRDTIRYSHGGWKANKNCIPEDITHFAFVLDVKAFCGYPLIYFVDIKHIREHLAEYPNSNWVHFYFWWIIQYYIPELSNIPKEDLLPKLESEDIDNIELWYKLAQVDLSSDEHESQRDTIFKVRCLK